ncbi:MAG: YaiO family outer membrane beta-barrel protein [Bacteroidales bacterium]|nr:YaiO family outer membrane beta-barrel protein [Bacteroidales bacterium]
MKRLFIITTLTICSLVQLYAQETLQQPNPEQEFARMRDLAAAGDYNGAKQIGYDLLEENEEYYDAALYLARIHGWESRFDSAYLVLDAVMARDPELYEAYETCVDLAYWENNMEKLETCAGRAVELEPDSAGRFETYRLALQQPRPQPKQPEIFARYSYDHFSVPYVRNWHMLTAGGELPFKHGTLIPSLNGGYFAGDLAQRTDLQINLDGYLTLGKKSYAMLGYGFSPNGEINFFPGHRGAAELWQVLPKGFALSAGLRYFYWDQHFPFLTFSAEKYAGNYWFSFRNYLFFKDYGVSGSYYLSARRYFDSKFNHLTLILGYGTAPDEPILVVSDLDRLNALSGRIAFSKKTSPVVRLNAMVGYAWEEYADQDYRHRIDMRVGAYFLIKR